MKPPGTCQTCAHLVSGAERGGASTCLAFTPSVASWLSTRRGRGPCPGWMKRKPGRPRVHPDQKAVSPPGEHGPAPAERLTRLRALLAIVDPINVLGDGAAGMLGRVVGVESGQIAAILCGSRSVGEERLAEWERCVEEARRGVR